MVNLEAAGPFLGPQGSTKRDIQLENCSSRLLVAPDSRKHIQGVKVLILRLLRFRTKRRQDNVLVVMGKKQPTLSKKDNWDCKIFFTWWSTRNGFLQERASHSKTLWYLMATRKKTFQVRRTKVNGVNGVLTDGTIHGTPRPKAHTKEYKSN